MDRTHVNCLAFLILLLGMTHVACVASVDLNAPSRKLASQRRLVELDFSACYAAYDQNVNILTNAVKEAYNQCVALCLRPAQMG
jgi:hypothetical protein